MTDFNSLEPSEFNDLVKSQPHGWIQFKGTDLCMDVYCKCGEHTHIDGGFLYFIKCGSCGAVYELNAHIQLIPRPDHIDHEIATTS